MTKNEVNLENIRGNWRWNYKIGLKLKTKQNKEKIHYKITIFEASTPYSRLINWIESSILQGKKDDMSWKCGPWLLLARLSEICCYLIIPLPRTYDFKCNLFLVIISLGIWSRSCHVSLNVNTQSWFDIFIWTEQDEFLLKYSRQMFSPNQSQYASLLLP